MRIPAWPCLNPSDLRHSVQIQSQSTDSDALGQPLQTWTTILTAQASIEAVKQNELYQAGQLTSQVTHTITLRWPPVSISAGMRAVYGAHVYKIQAVNNIEERNVVLKLLVLELNGAE